MHEEAPYIGWLFILLSVVCIVLSVAILFVDDASIWVLSGITCFAAVVAFLASRTIGLPQIGDDVGNWTEPLRIPAVASEALMTILAYAHLRRPVERSMRVSLGAWDEPSPEFGQGTRVALWIMAVGGHPSASRSRSSRRAGDIKLLVSG